MHYEDSTALRAEMAVKQWAMSSEAMTRRGVGIDRVNHAPIPADALGFVSSSGGRSQEISQRWLQLGKLEIEA
jgi:hypothetical protein